jgi:PTS system cellobiose-specific IIB component
MSTSLLARKMQDYAAERGIEAVVDARAVSAIKQSSIEQLRELDCALLGPQVAFEKAQFEPRFKEAGIPFAVIPMQDYGMVRGDKVMQMALDMIEAAKR